MASLKEWRAQRLLSIRELANRAQVAQRTIVQAEAGRQTPRPATMRTIAAALGIDPMEIDEFRAAIEATLADIQRAATERDDGEA